MSEKKSTMKGQGRNATEEHDPARGGGAKRTSGRGPGSERRTVALVAPPSGSESERSELELPEGGATSAAAVVTNTARPDPETLPQAKRRRFSAKFKLQILKQAEACEHVGELGALLRREGLYHSHLNTWRRQREDGCMAGLTPKKRGRKPDPDREMRQRNVQLEKENHRLTVRLEKAELIIEVQKKIAQLLGIEQPPHKGKRRD